LVVEVFGPTIEFLTSPTGLQTDFCILRGTIPPGIFVPLHSHPDVEDFIMISGELQALKQDADGYKWVVAKAGDYVHVPGGTPHAWRNISHEPAVTLLITTKKLGQFFREAGRPVTGFPQPILLDDLERFATIAKQYGYWNATPEENSAAGIQFSF